MKTMTQAWLLAAAILLCGCAANGGPDASAAAGEAAAVEQTAVAQADSAENYDPNEEICKWEVKTGTRIKSKVCATRRQWEMSEEYAQETTEKMQRSPKYDDAQ